MKKILSQKAFSLVEVLIAILIMFIVLTGGIAFYFNTDKLISLVVHKKVAIALANLHMEELRSEDYSTAVDETSTVAIEGLSATRTVTVVDNTDHKEVKVNVAWTEPGEAQLRDVEIMSYMAP